MELFFGFTKALSRGSELSCRVSQSLILCFISGFLKVLEIPTGARHLLIQECKASAHVLGTHHTLCVCVCVCVSVCVCVCVCVSVCV